MGQAWSYLPCGPTYTEGNQGEENEGDTNDTGDPGKAPSMGSNSLKLNKPKPKPLSIIQNLLFLNQFDESNLQLLLVQVSHQILLYHHQQLPSLNKQWFQVHKILHHHQLKIQNVSKCYKYYKLYYYSMLTSYIISPYL